MTMPRNAQPRVRIDWYADGDYTDAVDDVTNRVLGNPGLTVEWGRDTARSTAPPMIGAADCRLNNNDRLFSPENAVSPAYQFIKPGRPVVVDVQHGTRRTYRSHLTYGAHEPYNGLGTFPLLVGHADTFDQHPDIGDRTVGVTVLDRAARLLRRRISIAYVGTVRTDSAVQLILDAAGWPAADRFLHVSDSIMNGYWIDERPAWECLVELQATEGAGSVFFVDATGVFHWRNRNHRATQPRSTTMQMALYDVPTTGGQVYSRLSYDPRWDDIVNRVTVTTTQRVLAASSSVVWKLGTALTVPDIRLIWVRPTDPFQNAIVPVLGTDYTVTGGTVFVGLGWQSGRSVSLTILATSGSPTVNDLQVRAYPFTVVGETDYEATTIASDEEEKTLKINAWPMLDPNQAAAIADSYLTRYEESRPIIEVTFQNIDGAAMEKILYLQISDRVEITNQHLGLVSLPCYVERIKHVMTTGGKHEVTLSCEPVTVVGSLGDAWDSAVWDASVWGV